MDNDKGFTLLEVMITAVLFSMIFIITLEVLSSSRKAWRVGDTMQDLQVNLTIGMNNMIRELESSSSSSFTFFIPGSGETSDTARFMVPIGYSESGDMIWGADTVASGRIQYRIDESGVLLREVLASDDATVITARRLASSMAEVSFYLPSQSGNKLSISLTASSPGIVSSQALTAKILSVVRFNN